MPIKGVSDVVRLPRLGKISLGVKKETDTGTSYPSPTDHFVCPEEVRKIFGDKPKDLRIMFPTEDDSQWASQYLKYYSATRGLICRGDGEAAIARVDIRTGEIATREAQETELREIVCDPDTCVYYRHGQCKRVMNLQFLIPDCPGLGVYQLDTSSFYSIVNINSDIKLIRGICQRISMIPLSLRLVEQQVQPDGKKKTIHILSLTANYTLAEIQKYAQIPPGKSLLLPPPDTEAPEDLFPQNVIGQGGAVAIDEIPTVDEELLQSWEKIKKQLKKRDIQSAQVLLWFDHLYDIEVTLNDFEAAIPPEKFTTAMLTRFHEALLAYEEKLRRRR